MSDSGEPPPEVILAIGAALLLAAQPGGGLFGKLAYAAPKTAAYPSDLSFTEEEQP